MRLALFDLDHTLIPFDSGLAWTRFLAARGVLPPDAESVHLHHARQYVLGTLDIRELHRASVSQLSAFELPVLQGWAHAFEAEMAGRLPPDMQALVRSHLDAGDLCAVVTATTRLVAAPFARLFGVPHLVCTEAVVQDGRLTGEVDGVACFQDNKVVRVEQWLSSLTPARGLASFDSSHFYSDSMNDLPLLQAVTHPVAVRPDARLRAWAGAQGWPVI